MSAGRGRILAHTLAAIASAALPRVVQMSQRRVAPAELVAAPRPRPEVHFVIRCVAGPTGFVFNVFREKRRWRKVIERTKVAGPFSKQDEADAACVAARRAS